MPEEALGRICPMLVQLEYIQDLHGEAFSAKLYYHEFVVILEIVNANP